MKVERIFQYAEYRLIGNWNVHVMKWEWELVNDKEQQVDPLSHSVSFVDGDPHSLAVVWPALGRPRKDVRAWVMLKLCWFHGVPLPMSTKIEYALGMRS